MTTERRREGRLAFAPDDGVLVVGGRTAVLDAQPPAEVVVGTYVELVLAQRSVAPSGREDLRDRELDQLAALLALPPAELDALIDRELERLLAPADGKSRRPSRLVFGALAVVVAAVAAAAAAGAAGGSSPPAPEPGGSVETVVLPDGSTATRTESAPAPATDEVDINSAVVYEREP